MSNVNHKRAYRERLCNDCAHFVSVPFTVGKCNRYFKRIGVLVSIAKEREEPSGIVGGEYRCGRDGYWFMPKAKEDAA